MSENCRCNPLIPQVGVVIAIRAETADVKTFRVQGVTGQKPFTPWPGQLAMLSLFGVGEAVFSITAQGEDWLEFAVKKAGLLTEALHEISVGRQIGIRGPYGNHFPLEETKGRNLLSIGGGIGLAALRSFILHALAKREEYGHIDIVYGARSAEDIVFKEELTALWPGVADTAVHITVDKGQPGWQGKVGFVHSYVRECAFSHENSTAILCGPPVMIKLCLQTLTEMGFAAEDIITTLEMRMQCGIGKCGRCNIGGKYVCLDGPVFTLAQLNALPTEF